MHSVSIHYVTRQFIYSASYLHINLFSHLCAQTFMQSCPKTNTQTNTRMNRSRRVAWFMLIHRSWWCHISGWRATSRSMPNAASATRLAAASDAFLIGDACGATLWYVHLSCSCSSMTISHNSLFLLFALFIQLLFVWLVDSYCSIRLPMTRALIHH